MVSVAQTLVQAVLPKDLWLADRQLEVPWPMWGSPDLLRLDNAAEFHSRRWFVGARTTASGLITGLLKDLETDQGPAGHSYVFCYTPIALKPIAELIEALQPVIEGDSIASLVLAQKLQGRFRLLGPQGFTGIAMAASHWDVLAKSAGLSLTRLLGGEEKPVPAYHILGMAGPDGAAQEAAESIELGFRCVKFKVGSKKKICGKNPKQMSRSSISKMRTTCSDICAKPGESSGMKLRSFVPSVAASRIRRSCCSVRTALAGC